MQALLRRRLDVWIVALGAAATSAVAYLHYRSAGVILANGDAVSRLNIGRRVFDSLDPGLVQLGSIWPPMPQIVMLPLVWIEPLWRSGLAGSIPSMAAFVGATVYLYLLGHRLTGSRVGGLVAALVCLSNPNMLYLQAVPLSESLMLLGVVGGAYHLLIWLREDKMLHLSAAAAWVFVSSLTRYEGWALIAGGTLLVLVFVAVRHRDRHRVEALGLAFLMPAAYGVLLWLVWNAVLFGDPLGFAFGFGTARFDTQNPATHFNAAWNIRTTMLTYHWSVVDMIGLPVLVLAAVGLALLLRTSIRTQAGAWSAEAGIVLFVSLPALFVLLSLFAGFTIILGPHTPVPGLWNTRYGLQALPVVALLAAYPARIHRFAGVAQLSLCCLMIGASFASWQPLMAESVRPTSTAGTPAEAAALTLQAWRDDNFPVLKASEPLTLLDSVGPPGTAEGVREAARWLKSHQRGELVLISAFAGDAFIFHSGLPLDHFVFEGMQPYWDDELRGPGTWTTWIVLQEGHPRDLVSLNLGSQIRGSGRFQLVFGNDLYEIFRVADMASGASAGVADTMRRYRFRWGELDAVT